MRQVTFWKHHRVTKRWVTWTDQTSASPTCCLDVHSPPVKVLLSWQHPHLIFYLKALRSHNMAIFFCVVVIFIQNQNHKRRNTLLVNVCMCCPSVKWKSWRKGKAEISWEGWIMGVCLSRPPYWNGRCANEIENLVIHVYEYLYLQ